MEETGLAGRCLTQQYKRNMQCAPGGLGGGPRCEAAQRRCRGSAEAPGGAAERHDDYRRARLASGLTVTLAITL